VARAPSSFTKGLARAERVLRRRVPCRWPVIVSLRHRMKESGNYGCADVAIVTKARRHVAMIDIDDSLTGQEAIDTLIHEYAHVVAWGQDRDDHGPAWGKAYARCYRVVVGEGRRR